MKVRSVPEKVFARNDEPEECSISPDYAVVMIIFAMEDDTAVP